MMRIRFPSKAPFFTALLAAAILTAPGCSGDDAIDDDAMGDAGIVTADAYVPPEEDAAVPYADAAIEGEDAGAGVDASLPEADAASTDDDGGEEGEDAGAEDAGEEDASSDAGESGEDASTPDADASSSDADAGGAESDAGDVESDAGGEVGDAGSGEEDGGQALQPDWDFCEKYKSPAETASLADSRLTGVSGIVASRKNPGILWVHNDYKGPAIAYAVDAATGVTVATLSSPSSVTVKNVEDIALARCPWAEPLAADNSNAKGSGSAATPTPAYDDAPCLWMADSGNNDRNRADMSVVVMEEPDLDLENIGQALEEIEAEKAWRIPFAYPDDNCDSEGFVVEPDGSAFYLFEKVDADPARLFEAEGPFEDGSAVTLGRVGTVPAHHFIVSVQYGLMVTGADLHPSRSRLLLRTYLGSFEYRFSTDDWPRELPGMSSDFDMWGPLTESQGEAIAYDADGISYWTISEDKDQQPGQGIHHYRCEGR